jgi:hypothetical protein
MNLKHPVPNNWREEDREVFAETIAENVVKQMSHKDLERVVWDTIFDEMIFKDWPDLWEAAEEYAPELLEHFLSEDSKESQEGSY